MLSATARVLLSEHFLLIGWDRKRFWKELCGRVRVEFKVVTTEEQPFIKNFRSLIIGSDTCALYGFVMDAYHAVETGVAGGVEALRAKKAGIAFVERMKKKKIWYGRWNRG